MEHVLFKTGENILPFHGAAIYYPQFFSPSESDRYLAVMQDEIEWKQEKIKIFGKEVMQPRLTAFYGDSEKKYRYSGITMQPKKWTNFLLELKDRIEMAAGVKFTSALLNFYRDGEDSMGWHRDNEKELGFNPVIGSVSFGAKRTFQFRNYKEKHLVRAIDLLHGSFLLMKGETQHYWEHRLPKTNKNIQSRINLTFRVIKNPLSLPAGGGT